MRDEGGAGSDETTYWDQIPECPLADVTLQIVRRILGLRDKFGTGRSIPTQKMDVKSALCQVGVDPAGAVNFGYVLGGDRFVELRLQFGWRGSPGWRGRQSSGEYLGSARPLPREFSATINSFTFWREAGARGGHHGSLWACLGREVLDRRNVLDLIYGRSHMAIDPRIPTMLGRSVSGFHRPGRHRLLAPSAKRREVSGESQEG